MACNSCGNKSGFNGSCNSCSKVPDIDTETALETIKNGDENFCVNEVTDEICDNLQNDKGIHPFNGKNNTDCKDLHALNTYLNGNLWNSLKTLDFCDINALKCWLYNLVSNSWNMTKALVCAICGLWKKVHELEDAVNKIWIKLGKVEQAIDELAAQNWEVNSQYVIEYSTPGMSVSIDRNTGNFTFQWTDWLDGTFKQKLGTGKLTGKVNFGMGLESGLTTKWQIRSVLADTISYTTANYSDANTFAIHVYVKNSGEQEIYTRTHKAMGNFSDKINKTIPIDMKGVLKGGESTGWIQFLEVFNDNLASDLDDRANVQIKFDNNNKVSVPPYI